MKYLFKCFAYFKIRMSIFVLTNYQISLDILYIIFWLNMPFVSLFSICNFYFQKQVLSKNRLWITLNFKVAGGFDEMDEYLRSIIGCSSRRPVFNSQHSHSGSQLNSRGYSALLWPLPAPGSHGGPTCT